VKTIVTGHCLVTALQEV